MASFSNAKIPMWVNVLPVILTHIVIVAIEIWAFIKVYKIVRQMDKAKVQ